MRLSTIQGMLPGPAQHPPDLAPIEFEDRCDADDTTQEDLHQDAAAAWIQVLRVQTHRRGNEEYRDAKARDQECDLYGEVSVAHDVLRF